MVENIPRVLIIILWKVWSQEKQRRYKNVCNKNVLVTRDTIVYQNIWLLKD